MSWWRDWEKTGPRPVRDGLKARARKGSFSQTWWGRRWIEALEAFGWDNRLSRGRSYARRGQVVDLEVTPGLFDHELLDASVVHESRMSERAHVTSQHVLERRAPAPEMKKIVVALLGDVAIDDPGRQDLVDRRALDPHSPELLQELRMPVAQDGPKAREEDMRVAKLRDAGPVPFRECGTRIHGRRLGVALENAHVVTAALQREGRGKTTESTADDHDPLA